MNMRAKIFGSECILQGGFEEQWWRVFCNCMIVPDVITPEPLGRASSVHCTFVSDSLRLLRVCNMYNQPKSSRDSGIPSSTYRLNPLNPPTRDPHLPPLCFPLAIPLPLPPLPLPLTGTPLPLPATSPPPLLLSPDPGLLAGAGVANLVGTRELGGLSTKLVSVVKKVSSPKSALARLGSICLPVSFWRARLKDSGTGACVFTH